MHSLNFATAIHPRTPFKKSESCSQAPGEHFGFNFENVCFRYDFGYD